MNMLSNNPIMLLSVCQWKKFPKGVGFLKLGKKNRASRKRKLHYISHTQPLIIY